MLASLLYITVAPSTASAAPIPGEEIDANQFNPSRIIDDYIFTDTSTMSVEDIQRFLENNVDEGVCDRYRENIYDGSTNVGPYTCLFEFQQNIETGEHNYGLFDDYGAPINIEDGYTAAEMILEVADEHGINPQVLLVLLQKEQSLITDNWPWLGQFARATGYYCPDYAPCNAAHADFYKQVRGAAWQFRQYLDNIDDYWYIIGENFIAYNPNTNCGYKSVNIENEATIALYLYTPYVPNEAALNNLFGYGDSCSAYGNRNFWSYFLRWFGPTTDDDYVHSVAEEGRLSVKRETWSFAPTFTGVYTDPAFSISVDPGITPVQANQVVYVYLEFENTGSALWEKTSDEKQVTLVTPELRNPDLGCHQDWQADCQQVSSMQQDTVRSLSSIGFEFPILVPNINGEITEAFTLQNNERLLEGELVQITFHVYGAEAENIRPEMSSTPEPAAPPSNDNPPPPAPAPVTVDPGAPTTVVLPDNWLQLSVWEKISLNPWGCHDTTQIRADNGQCLSGGYTIPGQPAAPPSNDNPPPPAPAPVTVDPGAPTTVVLPDNWLQLSVWEKISLNPWGCHDTTQIRADNGQCLSGGYTIPGQPAAPPSNDNPPPPAPAPVTVDPGAPTTVVLPDNWLQLSVWEKISLNPWGCHDTTQIRADNGQCLSGGYTIPT